VAKLSLALGRAGIGILVLTPELATLEDLFFRLTEDRDGFGSSPRETAEEPSDTERLVSTQ
jgi:hypothetical protein